MISEILDLQPNVKWDDVWKLSARMLLNFSMAWLVIHMVYARLYKRREYIFTFYMFNLVTFSLCLLLRKVPAELGFALALFGVFGILRYRTETIRIRELTFLFIVIGIGILNAVANTRVSAPELLIVNGAIVGLTWFLEGRRGAAEESRPILYDNIQLLQPGRHSELISDLCERTGLDITRVEIHRVDLLRDAADVTIHYHNT